MFGDVGGPCLGGGGGGLGRVWGVSGACLGRVWGVSGACLGRVWGVSGGSGGVWGKRDFSRKKTHARV